MPSISHLSNKLYYGKHGSGEKVILLFHGFGQSLDVLIPIVQAQPNAYTYYLFDAPYHGKSTRRNSKF
ncbi:MAG: alpha/beta fold hydrolase [Cyclobacteriaceae bacterium]